MSANITPDEAKKASDVLLVQLLNQYRSDSGAYIVVKNELDRRNGIPARRIELLKAAAKIVAAVAALITAMIAAFKFIS